jgi:phage gp29-like protein
MNREGEAPLHIKAANAWRDWLNPLRSISMSQISTYLDRGQRGDYADLQWLYQIVERRWAVLSGLLSRFEGGMLKLDWDIKTVDESDEAARQAEVLRTAYDQLDNLRAALIWMVTARFRGYAHLEKNWTGDTITHLEPVPQWYWVRDGASMPWEYNRKAMGGVTKGEAVDRVNFIIRETARPIDELATIAFHRANLSQKDWDGFIEGFGIPPLFITGPPNVPPDQEATYQEAAEGIISNSRGYLPNGASVSTVDVAQRGNPFREHIRYQEESVVLAGTGGLLTMLTESGSGTLAGGAHSDAWSEILAGEAAIISEVFQRDFDLPLLTPKTGTAQPLAYFELGFRRETNVGDIVAQVAQLGQAGYAVDAAEVSERTGYTITPRLAAIPSPEPLGNRAVAPKPKKKPAKPDPSAEFMRECRNALATALQADMEPLARRIERAMASPDPVVVARELAVLREELPALLTELNAKPDTAKAIEGALGAATFNGLETASKNVYHGTQS